MDAAQTNFKKTAFFFAIALLVMAPFHASAQTLQASVPSVTIGNSACNNSQSVQLTGLNGTSSVNIPFTAAVQYQAGDSNGQWAYASISGSGTTSSATPINSSTTTAGVSLTIGLARTIGVSSDTAQVIITDKNNSSDVLTITVYYNQSTSCGGNTGSITNGDITVTPGNIALTTSQLSQPLAIANVTGSSLTFTVSTTQQNGTWLTATATSTTLSPNGSASVTVTANPANATSTGTLNGTVDIQAYAGSQTLGTLIVIPVTFATSGSGTGTGTGSGTLTLNGVSSNTYNATFQYTYPSLPSAQCVPLQDTASGANSYSYSVSTTSGGNWLLANFGTSGTVAGLLAPSSNACATISVSNSAGTLPSGAYQGTVTLTSSSGSTATINANLYVSDGSAAGISVTPGVIFSFNNVATNSAVVQQQTFTISASNGVGLGTAGPVAGNGSWFSMTNPTAANNTETFTVTVNSSGLIAGIYSAVITMSNSAGNAGYPSGTTYITVILPVGQPGATCTSCGTGTTVTSVVAPLTVAFQQQTNNSFWTSGNEKQNITITGAQGTNWSATITYAAGATNWLNIDAPVSASGTFGTGPATLQLDLFNGVGGLAASALPYAATLAITTPSGTYNVAVSLLVTPSNVPVLLGQPASSTFTANTGANPASQTVSIVGSDNTSSNTSPTIAAGTPSQTWLTATTSGNKLTISVSQAGLATGVYYGTIPITSTAYQNAIQYPVVFIVNGGGTSSGPLTLSPPSLSFSNVTGAVSSSLGVTATSSTSFTVTAAESSCTAQTWLQISPSGSLTASTVNTPINVTVTPTGIANGTTCSGVLTLVTSSGTQTENVTMTVGTTASGGNVTLNTTALSFAYTQGQSVPAAQNVTIVNAVAGTASIPFTVTTTELSGTSTAWLQVSTTSATTPYNTPGLSISISPGNLAPATYTGTVTITPTGGAAQNINVTFTLTGAATVTATPTTITLNYTVGATAPTSTIQVSGGGATAGFTATATSSAGWLAVSPTSGTTPNTGTSPLTVSTVGAVLSTLLPSGSPYTGTIVVAGTSPATGTTNVQVTLNVTAPLPVISGITNGASYATGAISPGELISIFAPTNSNNPIGPSTQVLLDGTTCPAPCTVIPTKLGGVQVKFLPSGLLAPLTFVNAGQINAVVPYLISGQVNVSVEVLYLGQTSNAFPLTVTATAPGIFTQNSSGTGPGSVEQYDAAGTYQGVNSASKPAHVGWTLVVFMTGEGVVQPTPPAGTVTVVSQTPPLTPVPVYVPTALIGSQPSSVTFYGEAPGLVSGVLQVNVLVPAAAPLSLTDFLSITVGPNSTQAGVTVSIQ